VASETSVDKSAKVSDGRGGSARMEEEDHRPMFKIMDPPLGWEVTVLSINWPNRSVFSRYWDGFFLVVDGFVHAFVLAWFEIFFFAVAPRNSKLRCISFLEFSRLHLCALRVEFEPALGIDVFHPLPVSVVAILHHAHTHTSRQRWNSSEEGDHDYNCRRSPVF